MMKNTEYTLARCGTPGCRNLTQSGYCHDCVENARKSMQLQIITGVMKPLEYHLTNVKKDRKRSC